MPQKTCDLLLSTHSTEPSNIIEVLSCSRRLVPLSQFAGWRLRGCLVPQIGSAQSSALSQKIQASVEEVMRTTHVPAINARYWTGITLASIFGTNLGDFYAHESGLSLIGGVPILVALFFLVYFIERLDKSEHDGYYW